MAKNKSVYRNKENEKYKTQGYAQYHKNKRKKARRFHKGLATYSG